MTRVAILPVPTGQGRVSYHAVAGDKQSQGRTAGEALDALTAQLPEEETGALVIVQSLRPDQFFRPEQQRRLAELMERWRIARDKGESLSSVEQTELDSLVEAELRACRDRTAQLADAVDELAR
ncbi:MAG: hypothetical protein AB1696_07485 [Planctomycetota bacterium]